jgi:hypothetical protein
MINRVVAFKKAISAIAFKKAEATVSFKKAIATIRLGNFLIFRFFFDVLGLSDAEVKSVGKSLADSQAVSDASISNVGKSNSDTSSAEDSLSFGFGFTNSDSGSVTDNIDTFTIGKLIQDNSSVDESIFLETGFNREYDDSFFAAESLTLSAGKVFAHSFGTTDSESFQLTKALSDESGVAENAVMSPNKVLQNSSLVSEDQNMGFAKFISEQTGVTDDLDGEATADDDQEMTFTKVRSDLATLVDSFAHSTGRGLSDTIGTNDSGSLRSQGYCAFDYFLEDYVGASQTF